MARGDLINRQTNQLTERAIHVTELLHTQLANAYPDIHLARLACVMDAVRGLVAGQSLQLTAIGRHLPRAATEKHAIKRVDRLLGNVHLAGDRLHFYHWQAQLVGRNRVALPPHVSFFIRSTPAEPQLSAEKPKAFSSKDPLRWPRLSRNPTGIPSRVNYLLAPTCAAGSSVRLHH